MANFRWLIFLIWSMGTIVVAMQFGDIMALFGKPWPALSNSILLPVIGLGGAWLIAPYNKHIAILGFYALGLGVAFYFSPYIYPAWHDNASQPTNTPFVVAAVLSSLIVFLFWVLSRHR